jgi:formylmethanofuran dehydrogenase subunit E
MKFRKPRGLNYADAIRFHGHDGPFLALGYRLGRYLMKTMKPAGIMDLRIRVRIKRQKPYTCVLDGLQCSTFATLGKGNLLVQRSSGKGITVYIHKAGNTRRFKMTALAMDICLRADDLRKAARKILRTDVRLLWSVSDY